MLTRAIQAFAIQTLACDDKNDASLKCRFVNIFNELTSVKDDTTTNDDEAESVAEVEGSDDDEEEEESRQLKDATSSDANQL